MKLQYPWAFRAENACKGAPLLDPATFVPDAKALR